MAINTNDVQCRNETQTMLKLWIRAPILDVYATATQLYITIGLITVEF